MQLNQQVNNKHNEGIVIKLTVSNECIIIIPTSTQKTW